MTRIERIDRMIASSQQILSDLLSFPHYKRPGYFSLVLDNWQHMDRYLDAMRRVETAKHKTS